MRACASYAAATGPRLPFGRMDSPDRLPGDQRAVLQLVLGQRRSYSDIAGMLSIAPEQVRDRARAALDVLGPPTAVPDAERGRIADYLLGQLPSADLGAVRDALAASPAQRAWARVVSAELRPLATQPLPQIPDGEAAPNVRRAPDAGPDSAPDAGPDRAPDPGAGGAPDAESDRAAAPRSSRTGGIVLLSLVAAAAIAAIVIFVLKPGGHSHHHSDAAGDGARASTPGPSSTSGSSSSQSTSASQSARIVGQINLAPPAGGTRTTGAALVLSQGPLKGLGIEAVHVPPNTTKPRTAYAVWLYNSPSDAKRLGYVNPPVSKNGKLDTSARLPANTSRYKLLIITLQTQRGTHVSSRPGPVVLEGKLSDVPKSRL